MDHISSPISAYLIAFDAALQLFRFRLCIEVARRADTDVYHDVLDHNLNLSALTYLLSEFSFL